MAIRRFNQVLIVFKPCFHGKETRKIRRRLKRVMVQAGEVRNHDIALKVLSKSTASAAAALRPRLQAQRKEAERDLVSLLRRWIDRKQSIKWRAVLEGSLSRADAAQTAIGIDETARQILPGMLKRFIRSGNAAANEKAGAEELHAFRIAAKKFRYSLEIFAPLYGPQCQNSLTKLKQIQDLLGENNDWATVERMVSRVKGTETLAAWLQIKQRKTTEEFCRYWRAEFGTPEQVKALTASMRRSRPRAAVKKKPVGRSEPPAQAPKSQAAVA